ncbi:Glycosyltransferase involved in cell wall bisynthesis [Roseateles sp. YR242]|uniref:glycosyltransferase n=1 Tax=Roseateles sp. YR242 TaxID=1855305 RepID=UPI0008C0176E|nr:glycosyltransferase [Roseateles sp. YR242]SEK87432.1 Glycosyltransferase involved in cell wall bisynthesis [Roseateles sp. YR242]
MKIAYLINHYPKVSHTFIRREIIALERQGVEVLRVAVRGWDDAAPDPQDQQEKNRTHYLLRHGLMPLLQSTLAEAVAAPVRFFKALGLALRLGHRADRPMPLHLIYLAEACMAVRLLRAQGISHVHAHFGTNSTEVALLIEALGGPGYSFTCHGSEEFDKPESLHLGEKIRRARFVVAITSFCRSQVYRWVDHTHWPKIQVVRCGVDPAFHTFKPVPATGKRLVAVGRLCEQKGHLLLLEAAARLAAEGVDFELVLAGDGELREPIEARIAELKLERKVRITGWIGSDQVREEMLAARALVVSSFAEGLPVVAMEAMALRRPVISTAIAGIPELVVPQENGWLVPAGDPKALARAMAACLACDDATLQGMGEAARVRVLGSHDVDLEASRLAALFRDQLGEEPAMSDLHASAHGVVVGGHGD